MAPGYAEAIDDAGAGVRRGQGPHRADAGRSAPSPNACRTAAYVEFEDSEHEILMENDSIRARFWKAFDAFTAANHI